MGRGGAAEFVEPADDLGLRRWTRDVPEGCEAVRSPMTASVWQVAVEPGQRVEAGQRILVLEAMKMEVAVRRPARRRRRSAVRAGRIVTAGQNLVAPD